MEYLINYLAIAAIAYLWVASLPTITLRELIGIKPENTINNKLIWWAWYLCNCSLCSGFWIGIAYSQNLEIASLISVLAEIIHRIMTKLNRY